MKQVYLIESHAYLLNEVHREARMFEYLFEIYAAEVIFVSA